MKLIIAVVDDRDADNLVRTLTDQHIGITYVSSTGGLVIAGNSTLLIGVEDDVLPQVMRVIAEKATSRQGFVPLTHTTDITMGGLVEVPMGGYLSFVLDVDQFEQV